MDSLLRDLRYGARQLTRHRGFTAAAVLMLALGIGAATAIFSLVDALFLRRLPVPNPSQIVSIYETRHSRGRFPLSYVDYLYYRDHNGVFSDLIAHYASAPIHLVSDAESSSITGSVVSTGYFPFLGLTPSLGRFFLEEEGRVPDRDAVVVVSHALWQGRLGRDPQIVGKTLLLNGASFTVVGVAPQGFRGLPGELASDVWIPSGMFHVGYRYCDALARGCTIVTLLGRLRPGRTTADAQAEMDVLARQLEASHPETNKALGIAVLPTRGTLSQGEEKRTVTLLMAAVASLLLIACANLAGLLLSRSIDRRKEVAVRLALGAGAGRLVRQLLTESLLLSLLGGAAGLLMAVWMKDVLSIFFGVSNRGDLLNVHLGLPADVVAFTAGLSLLTGIAFGLLPALEASRAELLPVLKEEGRSSGLRRRRLREVLVISQLTLSVALLIGAVLLVQSLRNVYRGPGFDPSHVLLLRSRPSLVDYDLEKGLAFQAEVIRRLETVPGVVSASPAQGLPFPRWDNRTFVRLPGDEQRSESGFEVWVDRVGPRYFETLGIPFVEGRDFEARDRRAAPRVAIVNETLARHFWPRENAAGRILIVDGGKYEIVGVAKDAQYRTHSESAKPCLYLDYWQQDAADGSNDSRTHVRVAADARAMLPLIRREITALDPNVPLTEDYPMTERIDHEFGAVRAVSTLLVFFGGLAVLLSVIGLYSVLAIAVAERTHEISLRMALGADEGDVAALVFRRGLALVALGTTSGTAVALGSTRMLSSVLFGVGSTDGVTFVGAPLLLLGVALLACYLPARRAMSVDPIVALRCG